MKKLLVCSLLFINLSANSKVIEWAIASKDNRIIILTDATCRYDKYFPEAKIMIDDKITYACYWSDAHNFYFQSHSKDLQSLNKMEFKLSKGIM